jgi:molybdate transport system substrate-binding protein
MKIRTSKSSGEWTAGLRVWLERSGRAVLGEGRLELLEGIDRWHSISAAARHMGMSYRHAWVLVQDMNEAAGEPLVVSAVGGTHGGGATLTDLGHEVMRLFSELQERLRTTAAAALPSLLKDMRAPTIHVAAAISLEEVLGRLVADFTHDRPQVSVRMVFGASDELADNILAGAPADLFLAADEQQMDRLSAAGAIEPAARVTLAGNSLTVVAAADGKIAVRRPADLLRSGVARIACAKPGSPLGEYSTAYLKKLGIYDELRQRLLPVDNSRMVVAAIHGGLAEVGLVYGSDACAAGGCCVLFRAPRSATPIRFIAGLVRGSRQHELARLFLDFLTSRAAQQRFRQCGFLPAC